MSACTTVRLRAQRTVLRECQVRVKKEKVSSVYGAEDAARKMILLPKLARNKKKRKSS